MPGNQPKYQGRILREQSLQMAFILRNHAVQQVSSAAFDQKVRYTVLPGTPEWGSRWAHFQGSNRDWKAPDHISHLDRISETWEWNQKLELYSEGVRLDQPNISKTAPVVQKVRAVSPDTLVWEAMHARGTPDVLRPRKP